MALPIPNDWNMQDYEDYTVTIPKSGRWIGAVKGALLGLTNDWAWDDETGDPTIAVEVSWQIFESMREAMKLQWIVYLSGNQTVSGGGNDELYELDTVEYDPLSQFDLVNHRWVVPDDGLYLLGGFVQFWDVSGSSDVWARVRTKQNGIYHLNSGNYFQSDLDYVHAKFELPCRLSQGDVIEYFVAHSDGSSRDTADYNKTQRAWCYKL